MMLVCELCEDTYVITPHAVTMGGARAVAMERRQSAPSERTPITAELTRSRSFHSRGDSPTRTIENLDEPEPGPWTGTVRQVQSSTSRP